MIYPGLQTGTARERADKYLSGGYGGLVGFELAAGREAGRRFIDALELHYHVANIGDARSLAIHPASTTHSQLTAEDQLKTGVTPAMSVSPSASNISTTFWPTWSADWKPHKRSRRQPNSHQDFKSEHEMAVDYDRRFTSGQQ